MNALKSKLNPVSSLHGFWSYFSQNFNKLKFVPEEAPRREERKFEMLSNFPRRLSVNLNIVIKLSSMTVFSCYIEFSSSSSNRFTGKLKFFFSEAYVFYFKICMIENQMEFNTPMIRAKFPGTLQ